MGARGDVRRRGGVAGGVANDVLPPAVLDTLRRRPPRAPTYLEHIERYFDPALHERMRAADHERWRPPIREWRLRQLRQVSPVTTVRIEEHELRGARYGVDLRHPFADRKLVEFLVSLPAAIKSDPMRAKALLRDALAGHAPDEVVQRSEKPGYLSVLERRVDRGRCLDWVKESGIRLPLRELREPLPRRRAEAPLFLLLLLARAHVFAAAYGLLLVDPERAAPELACEGPFERHRAEADRDRAANAEDEHVPRHAVPVPADQRLSDPVDRSCDRVCRAEIVWTQPGRIRAGRMRRNRVSARPRRIRSRHLRRDRSPSRRR